MRRLRKWIVPNTAIAVLASVCLCLPAQAGETKSDSKVAVKEVAEDNFAFGCELYKTLAKDRGNVFFSPHSISNALAVVLAGARGDTAKEMAKVLKVCGDEQDYHDGFRRLNEAVRVNAEKGKAELAIANAFWRDKALTLRPEFVKSSQKAYDVGFNTSDFVANAEAARVEINEWTEKKTKGKIKDLLARGAVNDKTRFVLVNAVYFKGMWSAPFPKKQTKEEPFLAGFKDRVQVPMMKQELKARYHSANGIQAVMLPYLQNRLSLVAFVAESEKSLEKFESRLSPRVVNDFFEKMFEHSVNLSMPRFRLEDHFLLRESLRALGMSKAFSDDADLSGIAGSREKLNVGAVIHKSNLDVNEEGTEAAAATAVISFVPVTRPETSRIVNVVLDRPFVFLIRENETGAVLFLGRFLNPPKPAR